VTTVTDAGLALLVKSLPKLRSLDLGMPTTLTHAGYAELRKLTRLRDLRMDARLLKAADFESIGKLQVHRLSLRCATITDDSIRHIAAMTRLEHLDLFGSHQLTDKGVAQLAALKSLRSLSVGGTRGITDDTLRKLSDLPLESLDLTSFGSVKKGGMKITDRGLEALALMPTLKRVVLTRVRLITPEGVAHLRIATTGREVITSRKR